MVAISPIANAELGSSVRTKLNASIARANLTTVVMAAPTGGDDTANFNAAITAAKADPLNGATMGFNNWGVVYVMPGLYRIDTQVNAYGVCLIAPNGAYIHDNTAVGSAAFRFSPTTFSTATVYPAFLPPSLKGFFFCPRTTNEFNASFNTTGKYALELINAGIRIEDCRFNGYDYPFKYGSDAYLHIYRNCAFNANTRAVYWPGGYANAGERMVFDTCNLSGNTKVFELNLEVANTSTAYTDWYFDKCSFDFNGSMGTIDTVASSPNDIGSSINLSNCHIEATLANHGTTAYWVSAGDVKIVNTMVMMEKSGTSFPIFFENNKKLSLIGNTFVAQFNATATNPWCTGTGLFKAVGNTQSWGGNPVYITATKTDAAL